MFTVYTKRLHREMGLVSLEQRRNIQILKLLYVRSKNSIYIKKPVRALRGNAKVKFKLMSRGKYMGSPLIISCLCTVGQAPVSCTAIYMIQSKCLISMSVP